MIMIAYFLKSADVSTTMIVKPGPVIDFLLSNQNVNDPSRIDWQKVNRTFGYNFMNDHATALKYLFW
jgi:hypothetical protein